ncbi:PucR family transcriptional regulator [Angustibacter sp. McL0619]|uniref:PucR family transcriptional regulator n=1 Tax=Angustibacter sp. McL0619 TaxID=3415676 RepID=UPI003CE921A0
MSEPLPSTRPSVTAGVAGARTRRRIEQGMPELARLATSRMEATLPWYRALSAQDRSWVGLVAQAGVGAFLAWFRDPSGVLEITADVFGTAPRELTRAITLRQTLDLVRTVVDVVEDQVDELAAPGEEQALRVAVLRYSREVAFAAAEVYAQAAESRGAWDARLESLVVDAVLRGEADDALQSRAAALGWDAQTDVVVVAGAAASGSAGEVVESLRQHAKRLHVDALAAVQGGRLVAVLGGVSDPLGTADGLSAAFADGPVVVGPTVPHLFAAGRSARAALAGLVAARAWPEAPRPVLADDLLPERVLAGDTPARRALVDRVYRRLQDARGSLLDTVSTYLEAGGSLEASARILFVHPNTVRYRLRRAAETCGYDVMQPRDAYVVRMALALGRLSGSTRRPTSAGGPEAGPGDPVDTALVSHQ